MIQSPDTGSSPPTPSGGPRTDSRSLLIDGKPDWQAIPFDVHCSRCEYNLRMLAEPRCPECGLEFGWRDVLDRASSRSTWLFEHQWRKQPISSWIRTICRSMRPHRFWASVSIHDEIEAGPLWFLLLTAPVAAAMAFLVILAVAYGVFELGSGTGSARQIAGAAYTAMGYLFGGAILGIFLPMTVFLLAVLAMISSLRQTLGRCRVRPVQTLRVVAYAAGPICLVPCGLMLCLQFLMSLGRPGQAVGLMIAMLACATIATLPIVYLRAGLQDYLRLPHTWAVAIVSVLVAYLFIATVGMVISTN